MSDLGDQVVELKQWMVAGMEARYNNWDPLDLLLIQYDPRSRDILRNLALALAVANTHGTEDPWEALAQIFERLK